jgi:hypothetical protein
LTAESVIYSLLNFPVFGYARLTLEDIHVQQRHNQIAPIPDLLIREEKRLILQVGWSSVYISLGLTMARIFISYNRADRQFVDDLAPLLRRVYGHDSLWYDDDIHGGADWWHMILSEIAACELFVYLISNDSLASPYCQAEMREGLRLRKQILPVIVRPKTDYPGVMADDLKQILQDTQYVDMAQGVKDTNALTFLYASANRLLAKHHLNLRPH